MKRKMILLLLVLLISYGSAFPQLNVSDTNPQPYETVIGSISNFEGSLESSDLKFFEGRRETSFEKDMMHVNNTYYFFVVFGREGNFSLVMEDLVYKQDDQLKEISLTKNFTVKKVDDGNGSSILSVRPGFLDLEEAGELTILNRGDLPVEFKYLKDKTTLVAGDSKKIVIKPDEEFSEILIESYKDFSIPVKYKSQIDVPIIESKENLGSLRASYEKIRVEKLQGENFLEPFELYNFGEFNITKIKIISELKFLKIETEEEISIGESSNVTLKGVLSEAGSFKDKLSIKYSENSSEFEMIIPLEFYVYKTNSTPAEKDNEAKCWDLGGGFCDESETCDGKKSIEIEGCCIGGCIGGQNSSGGIGGNGGLVGIIILLIVGIVGYLVWKKYKGFKPKQGEDQISEAANSENPKKQIIKKYKLNLSKFLKKK